MKPKFDKRTYMKIKGSTPEKMFAVLEEIYRLGFEDGANADVDPDVDYIAIRKGVVYECEVCGATLLLEDLKETQ